MEIQVTGTWSIVTKTDAVDAWGNIESMTENVSHSIDSIGFRVNAPGYRHLRLHLVAHFSERYNGKPVSETSGNLKKT